MFFRRYRKSKDGKGSGARPEPSAISRDVVIEGNLTTGGELQIDGTVHGNVRALVCLVEANGVVQGEVAAEEVFVRGRVVGPIRGIHVHLYSGAHVEGDVINESISVENGAYIYGSIRRAEDPLAEPARPAAITPLSALAARFAANTAKEPHFEPIDEDEYRPIKAVRPR